MDKPNYNQMIHAQEAQYINAWRFVFDKWACKEWQPLPSQIKLTLGLSSSIGVCSGMLVTQGAAKGITEFIDLMNRKRL